MKQNTHLLAHVAMSPGAGAGSSSPRSAAARIAALAQRPVALDAVEPLLAP
jgi:hypothetical protein